MYISRLFFTSIRVVGWSRLRSAAQPCVLVPPALALYTACGQITAPEYDDYSRPLTASIDNIEPVDLHAEAPAPIDDENDLVAYVAQCESVLGPIPQISCDPARPAPGTHVTRIPVFVEGHLLAFGEEHAAADAALLAQRRESQDFSCDFPSLGGDFACNVGSTLVQYSNPENPNVQWMGLCRGAPGDTPAYDRFIGNGLIGANEKTGEMCFFFASNPEPDQPYLVPRLTSAASSAEELGPWLAPRDMPGSCLSCHPNNDPWVQTPWLQPDYMRRVLEDAAFPLDLPSGVEVEDVLASRYMRQTPVAHKTLLPEPLPVGRSAWTEEEIVGEDGRLLKRQYRAVGSSYVSNEADGTVGARTGLLPDSWGINFRERLLLVDQENACSSGCHAIGNENFDKLAKDSLRLAPATKHYSKFPDLTPMSESSWMPPFAGLAKSVASIYTAGAPLVPAITECPIPKQLHEEPSIEIACSVSTPGEARVRLRWAYHNDFGEVPARDDVRFDVSLTYYDSDAAGFGVSENGVEGVRMPLVEGVQVLRDVAPDAADPASYQLELALPVNSGEFYVGLQPKRFCFEEPERRPYAYAKPLHITVDVRGACN